MKISQISKTKYKKLGILLFDGLLTSKKARETLLKTEAKRMLIHPFASAVITVLSVPAKQPNKQVFCYSHC
jgi:hypothetical protein